MIKRNYRRARKGGRNEDAQIATVSQDSLEKMFPKEVYSVHGASDGCSTKDTQWLYVRRKRNERAPTKIAL
jgi:hypothetical protein